MNDDILRRLEKLERESRQAKLWKYACMALLAAIVAGGVKAQVPGEEQAADGNFDAITANSISVKSLSVKGFLTVSKLGGGSGGDITLSVNPNPTILLLNNGAMIHETLGPNDPKILVSKGNARVIMSATDTSGEMEATDSGGSSIMKFPKPKP
jgi:hypothetical protein